MEQDYLIKLYGKEDIQKTINCTKEVLFDKIRELLGTRQRVKVNEEYLSIGEYELHIYTLERCNYLDFEEDIKGQL